MIGSPNKALPWATVPAEWGDGTTDHTTDIQAILDVRQHVIFPYGTYKITASLVEKFSGRIVCGLDSFHTVIQQATAGEHGVTWVGDAAPVTPPGAGIFATSWRDMLIQGPGEYDNSTGLFTGSTGDGFHIENGGGTYYGDEHIFSNLHIQFFARQLRINGIGNTRLFGCALGYGGDGLSIGGASTNSITSEGLITSNLAGFNLDIQGGTAIDLGLADTTTNKPGSATQLNVGSASVLIRGGNFENCSDGGNVVNCNGGTLTMLGSQLTRGGGADNTAIVSDGVITLIGVNGLSGFTTPYAGTGKLLEYGDRYVSIPPPNAGGGILLKGTPGGSCIDIGFDWERNEQGDVSVRKSSAGGGTPSAEMASLSAATNRAHVGWNSTGGPTGTAALNVYGDLYVQDGIQATAQLPAWTFDSGTGGNPGAGQFQLDNANPTSVSNIYFGQNSKNGGTINYGAFFTQLALGARLILTSSLGKSYAFYPTAPFTAPGSIITAAISPQLVDSIALSGDYTLSFAPANQFTADTGWVANADAGDKTDVIATNASVSTQMTNLAAAIDPTGTIGAAAIFAYWSNSAEKTKAIEAALVGLEYPNA